MKAVIEVDMTRLDLAIKEMKKLVKAVKQKQRRKR